MIIMNTLITIINDFLDNDGQAGNDYFDGPSVPENIVVDITK